MGVEDHLPRLAGVGPDERHAAVAEPQMRHLHRDRRPGDQHHLLAPVELAGFARVEDQRHERRRRAGPQTPFPRRRVAPHRVVAALVAETAQILEHPKQRHALARAPSGVDPQHLVQRLDPRPELRLRLNFTAVLERCLVRAQHLAHCLPRELQFQADLLDRLALNKMCTTDLRRGSGCSAGSGRRPRVRRARHWRTSFRLRPVWRTICLIGAPSPAMRLTIAFVSPSAMPSHRGRSPAVRCARSAPWSERCAGGYPC